MTRLFPTQEIGSLAKPGWLTHISRTSRPSQGDVESAERWGRTLGIPEDVRRRLNAILTSPNPNARKSEVREIASLYMVRMLESAGLDHVYDGEATRIEMYEYPVRYIEGFRFLGHVRSFDNRYYRKAACVAPVSLKAEYHTDEFRRVRAIARKRVKVPITGAYTLADWSFNEHYLARRRGTTSLRRARSDAKREFVLDLAEKVIRPNLRSLADAGAEFIQIDEPAAATRPEEVDMFVECTNVSTEGIDAKLSLHICFSDYASLFPSILDVKRCSQFTWEFANRDDDSRSGYRVLDLFREYGDDREIGLGVLDVHVDDIESPELVRDRILHASRTLGPERIYVNPDCGLRTRSWEVSYAKLRNMTSGAGLARSSLE